LGLGVEERDLLSVILTATGLTIGRLRNCAANLPKGEESPLNRPPSRPSFEVILPEKIITAVKLQSRD
jgi:hypothetical protein